MPRPTSPVGTDEYVAMTFATNGTEVVLHRRRTSASDHHSAFGLEHFGVPAKDYLRLARAGAFPTKRRGRLRLATSTPHKAGLTA